MIPAAMVLVVSAQGVSAQPAGPPPTVPGSAVLHVTPIAADTLPILCHDAVRPERGFVTETSDPEWSPRYDLALWPTNEAASELAIRLDLSGNVVGASFPTTPSNEGLLTVVAWVEREDGSGGRQISFTARCGERLIR